MRTSVYAFRSERMSLRRAEERNNPSNPRGGSSACVECASRQVTIVQGESWARAIPCQACSKSCDTCDATGFVFHRNATGSMDSMLCPSCSPIRTRIELYNQAKIPRRYASAQLRDFQYKHDAVLTKVFTEFRGMLQTFKPGDPGIGLSGGVGNGKTMLMASFLRFMTLHREIPSRFIEFSHLLSDIRAGYDAGRSESETISHLVDIPILVIDELGKSMKTEWQVAILDELISRRYNRGVSTFFTTNFPFTVPKLESRSLTRDDFKVTSLEERIGSRMYSRLHEMCKFYTFTAPDMRRTKL